MALTRQQKNAEAVLAQLRGVGPQTVTEIRADLGMTKADVEHALWVLGSRAQVEYEWPMSSPPKHKASATMREP